MKQIFLFLLIILSSCSSVKYYEYYHNSEPCHDLDCPYTYCTLEIQKDKAIYRAYTNHYVYQEKETMAFLYIETEKEEDWSYVPLWNFSKLYYYDYPEHGKEPKYRRNERSAYSLFDGGIKRNTLSDNDRMLFAGYRKNRNTYYDVSVSRDPADYHFDDYGLDLVAIWFPRELKRVKKLDYSKFPEDIQKYVNLKNPDADAEIDKKIEKDSSAMQR